MLRDEALREVSLRPDPVDLALQYSAELGADAVVAAFTNRRAALRAELDAWQLLYATVDTTAESVVNKGECDQQIRCTPWSSTSRSRGAKSSTKSSRPG